MNDDSSGFSLNGDGEEETGPLGDSDKWSDSADPTVPDPHARSRRFDFRGKIGNFSVNREIGRGGMGVVYEATEAVLNRRVALKILPPEALIDEIQIRRFKNEAAAAAQLVHPNIVPVYSVGSDRGVHFYAMQLIDGQNIAQVIGSIRERLKSDGEIKHNADTPRAMGTTKRAGSSTDPNAKASKDVSSRKQLMEEDFAAAVSNHRHPHNCERLFKAIASIGCDAARAIHHAHEAGVIHRDIKPHNLMLDEKGKVWITDFGLAQIRDNPVGTGTGDILGTLKYMSPEQASGRKFLVDHRTDIYSLGITLYELLTLKPALSGVGAKEIIRQVSFEDPIGLRAINPRIPAELETIISKAIAKNPQERYDTAAQFADDLERFCNDQPIAARPPSVAQKVRRWVFKNPATAGMLGVGMIFTFFASLGLSAATYRSNQVLASERERAVSLLSKSEGWRLLTHSRSVLPKNPGLAVALAREGSKRIGGLEANMAMQDAIAANHELQLLVPRPELTFRLALANRSQKVISTVAPGQFGKGSFPAIVIGLNANEQPIRLDSGDAITSAAFSPNEQMVLTASSGILSSRKDAGAQEKNANAAAIWELSTGRRVKTLVDHPIREANEQAFSPDGSSLVLPGPDNEATVYSMESLARKFALREHKANVLHAVFSPNGALIATSDASGEILIWDAADGKLKKRISPIDTWAGSRLQFSFDSRRILIATTKGTWSHSTADDPSPSPYWQESAFEMSPSQNRCASYSPKGRNVNIRDVATGTTVCEIDGLDPIGSSDQFIHVAFINNSQQIAVASGTSIRVHDAASGFVLYELLGHTAPVTSLKYNTGKGTIVSAAVDGSIRIWSPLAGSARQTFESITDGRGSSQIQFSADSRYVITGSNIESRTFMFDAAGKRVNGVLQGDTASRTYDSQQIAVKNGSSVAIIDPASSRIIKSRAFPGTRVDECMPINNSTAMIVTFDVRPPVYWNTVDDLLLTLIEKGDSITCKAASIDSSHFIIGTANGRIQIHESSTGKKVRTLFQHLKIQAVGYMPDQLRIFSVDDTSRLRIWGNNDELPEQTIADKDLQFTNAFPSPDGKLLIAYHDWKPEPVCCFDTMTGKLLHKVDGANMLKVVPNPIKAVAYLASREGGLKAWNYETNEVSALSPEAVVELVSLKEQLFTIEFPAQTSFKSDDFMQVPQESLAMIRGYSMDTGESTVKIVAPEGTLSPYLSVNLANNQIAASVAAYSATLAERANTKSVVQVGGHSAPISFSTFVGKNDRVVTASWDGTAKIWGENNQLLYKLEAHGRPITCGAITLDGQTLACGHDDGSIVLWNPANGEHLVTLKASDASILSLAFDKSGQNLLSTEKSTSVRYWNLISRNHKEVKVGESGGTAILSPDNHHLLSFAHNGKSKKTTALSVAEASIVNLETQKAVALPKSSGSRAGSFSTSGKSLGLVLNDGSAVCYTISSEGVAKEIQTFRSGSFFFSNIVYGADDNTILLCSDDGVSIWDVASGQQLHSLQSPSDSLHFSGRPSQYSSWSPLSPDGQWIGMSTSTETIVYPFNPLQVVDEYTLRTLLPSERELFHVGLADSVQSSDD